VGSFLGEGHLSRGVISKQPFIGESNKSTPIQNSRGVSHKRHREAGISKKHKLDCQLEHGPFRVSPSVCPSLVYPAAGESDVFLHHCHKGASAIPDWWMVSMDMSKTKS